MNKNFKFSITFTIDDFVVNIDAVKHLYEMQQIIKNNKNTIDYAKSYHFNYIKDSNKAKDIKFVFWGLIKQMRTILRNKFNINTIKDKSFKEKYQKQFVLLNTLNQTITRKHIYMYFSKFLGQIYDNIKKDLVINKHDIDRLKYSDLLYYFNNTYFINIKKSIYDYYSNFWRHNLNYRRYRIK